ncbi:MAG: FtsH protease activity modulator HflK [Fusobacteriota bacterium]
MSNEPNMRKELEKIVKYVKGLGFLGIIIVLGLYLATGVYIVEPDEQGVVLTYGKYQKTVGPGMNWHFPSPIGNVLTVKTTKVYRMEIGYRTVSQGGDGSTAEYRTIEKEALMLTGDENILMVNAIVQYKIRAVKKYLFNLINPQKVVKDAAEASLREIVGKAESIDEVLTEGKGEIQAKTLEKLQTILDEYDAGINIINVQLQDVTPPKEVASAFKEVASAREDRITYINQAIGYRNDIIPKARGNAKQEINNAEAYKSKRTQEAQGDVARFLELQERYKLGKEVTRTRLYLETLEEVLPNVDKTIIDSEIKNGVLNILNKEGVIK